MLQFEQKTCLFLFLFLRDGFEAKQIEALLHETELSLKHQSTSFGLHLGIVRTCSLRQFVECTLVYVATVFCRDL